MNESVVTQRMIKLAQQAASILTGPTKQPSIPLPSTTKSQYSDDVDWFEAEGNYVRVHVGKSAHLVRDTLSNLESRLDPEGFRRIHRSTIVNVERVRELQAVCFQVSGNSKGQQKGSKRAAGNRPFQNETRSPSWRASLGLAELFQPKKTNWRNRAGGRVSPAA